MTALPTACATGRDSPVISASSANVSPATNVPSAGNASPGNTRITSPTFKRRAATRTNAPSSPKRSTVSGRRCMSASREPAVRARRRCSSQRPVSRKNTNIVRESKYTACPHQPCASKVAALLTAKVTAMPKATGKSMLMLRRLRSRSALSKNGPHENSTTGRLSTHDAQRSSFSISGVMSPGCAK